MSDTMESYTPEETTECAREAVREEIVLPSLVNHSGPIAEVHRNGKADFKIRFYEDNEAYRRTLRTSESLGKQATPEGEARFGLWLFGPERVENPAAVYRALSDSLEDGATILIASEVPWPGKILGPDETAEFTAEETSASFVRAGFTDVDRLVEGPFFRIWRATKSEGKTHAALIRAEEALAAGEPAIAEQALEGITDQMDSVETVREFALLVAACHDLAGRRTACMDALSEALMLDPRCARAMCGLGRIAALSGELESAAEFFDAALKCEPALVAALHGQAVVREAKGDLDGAFSLMMTASDLRPKSDALLNETSRIGNQLGKLDEVSRFIAHRFSYAGFVVTDSSDLESPMSSSRRN